MPVNPYLQVDVFAARRGGGNPLGVVLDADDWSVADMQAFARWTNLVETTFVMQSSTSEADYRVRIFTPHKEIPFAGHPSIGTAHALLDSGRLVGHGDSLVQECGAGLLPLRIHTDGEARLLYVRSPAAQLLESAETELAAARCLLPATERADAPLACLQGGRRWWLAEFSSTATVRDWQPPHADIAALAHATDSLGLCVFARESGAHAALVVRAFPAGVGIVEDPASGAANGMIASWLLAREPAGAFAHGYTVSQGREIGHDARIDIEIDADTEVWVGGSSNTILRGSVDWNTP